jgi:hypothetical protein
MSSSNSSGLATDLATLAISDAPAAIVNTLSTLAGHGIIIGNAPGTPGHGITNGGQTSVTNQSSVDALAVNTAEADYLAATGVALNGAGLKIGILSDSFNLNGGEAADIADGDLPAASNIHIIKEGTSGDDEGRALAQLIHSIAPDAQIYFYSGLTSESDFATGINTLTSLGVNAIIDDITYTDEPFYQDTGVITKAVEASIAKGVTYISSAGNSSDNFYEAAFAPMSFALPGIGTETTHDVGGGSPYEEITLGNTPLLDLTLQWTQPWGANQYDIGVGLYSFDSTTNTYTLVQNFTASTLGGDPILSIYGSVNVTAGAYYLAFYESGSNQVNGAAITPGTFKIISFPDSDSTIDGTGSGVGSGTSIGHELAPKVNTIAAVNVANTPAEGAAVPVVAPYSGAGAGETYINAAGVTLAAPINDKSPNFAATDGSPTSVFNPFYGTSAAAASAAAVTLLVLQADPKLTPVQVTYLLQRSAIATVDPTTGGAGLIQADVAVSDALMAATTPVWMAVSGSGLWSNAADWSDGVVPAAGSIVKIVDGIGALSGAYTVTFNETSDSIASLKVDGQIYTGAVPDLAIEAGDALTTGSVILGTGTIDVAGTLTDTGAVAAGSGAGRIAIESTGLVSIAAGMAAEAIGFSGVGGDLVFGASDAATLLSGLDAVISNFAAGDVIDLSGLAIENVSGILDTAGTVTLFNAANQAIAVLQVSGPFTTLGYTADANGGTELVADQAANFENINVAGQSGPQAVTVGGSNTGLLQITNTNGAGATTAGAANVSLIVPVGYNTLIVSAPGTITVQGNGASHALANFLGASSVTYNTGGGSGVITASGPGDLVNASGTDWTVNGAAGGGDTINAASDNAIISTYGQGRASGNAIGADSTPSNVVGLAGTSATVSSNDTNGLIETYSGNDIISVNGSANVLINGGADTVYATASSTAVRAFFNLYGGTLDFINNSGAAATVSGAVPGASGGSTTAFGGAGGGVYIGGNAGNNSLVGGSGSVNLVAAGTNNFLSVSGSSGSYATQNILDAGDGGATMIAGSTTGFNEFYGGTGTDLIISGGSGAQTFYVGASGSELITGSTVTGADNQYIFNQDGSGSGQDVITNFRQGIDQIDINGNGTLSGVSISGIASLGGAQSGSIIYLSDRTTIQLYGVKPASLGNVIGAMAV